MRKSPLTTLLQATGAVLASSIGSWIFYSRFGIDHNLPLNDAIEAKHARFRSDACGFLSYYADISAERVDAPLAAPLVLIHSINAAGCSFEMRPIFQAYRGMRDVYALDLPGFGFSERADRVYSYDLYKQAILDLLERIGKPVDVIALSLSSEFAARAALERPELFRSLTMISPSGFNFRDDKRASQAASQRGSSDSLYRAFSFPLWAQSFYDLIATRKSIHYFLQQSFENQVDPDLEAYAYQTTHQPGARYAPLYFVSGKLFSPDIREKVYEKLMLPVLVLFDRDNFVRFDTLPQVVDNHENWHAVRIAPTKGLPQFEKLADVTHALDEFWSKLALEVSQ
ncbi:MAG: alpha/beta fold hydrolase [Chloroflexi bacterium]|nr:alpha/beta fold hydrolase [Chloroflexota bacterium]